MYGWEPRVLLRHYLEQGLSKTAIAERIGISRRCLYKWIAEGDLERELDVTTVRYPRRPTQLDPYHALIRQRLETYPELTAVRLFEEVRAAGYPGSLTQVKVFVRRVRPVPPPEETIRFETSPGQQAQVDFAQVAAPRRQASAIRRSTRWETRAPAPRPPPILHRTRPRSPPLPHVARAGTRRPSSRPAQQWVRAAP